MNPITRYLRRSRFAGRILDYLAIVPLSVPQIARSGLARSRTAYEVIDRLRAAGRIVRFRKYKRAWQWAAR